MATAPAQFPNQYRGAVLTGTSTGDAVRFDGFAATSIRLVNAGQVPVHFRLDSTSVATTGDHPLQPGEAFQSAVPWCVGFGAGTASTSTGAQEKRLNVYATG